MFRQWMVLSAGLFLSVAAANAAVIGVAGDGFNLGDPSYKAKLEESGHNFVQLPNFNASSLQGLDAVWLDGFSAYSLSGFDLSSTDLQNFVKGGGLLLVQSPGFGFESVSEYPFAENLSVTTSPSEATIRIRVADPYLDLVTDPDLSDWTQAGTSGNFTQITGWTGLADNGTDGQWVTISRKVDSGAAVYTFQDISRMMFEPKADEALKLLDSIIPVPEPATFALFGVGAVALLARRRRK